jgi:hypothetical protein
LSFLHETLPKLRAQNYELLSYSGTLDRILVKNWLYKPFSTQSSLAMPAKKLLLAATLLSLDADAKRERGELLDAPV